MLLTVLIFLGVLSLLVLVHEWGHYAAARKMGMDVEEFGIGFPPRIFGKKDKHGTLWSVNLIPLGGFVRIKGENGQNRAESGAFAGKSIPARVFVLLAGVLMNFLLAWVLFSVGFLFGLPAVVEGMEDTSAIITDRSVHVVQVLPQSPAAQAGLKEGDKILSIDGKTSTNGVETRQALTPREDGGSLTIAYERDGQRTETAVTPAFIEEVGRVAVGVAILETGTVRFPVWMAPLKGAETTAVMTLEVIGAFFTLIASLFSEKQIVAELSGPVGIAVITGEVARLGFAHLLQFAAMLSVNLAVLNAIPFPALDGGRIFFVFIEGVRRRPTSITFEQSAHTIGFALLILLVIFVTYKDIVRLF